MSKTKSIFAAVLMSLALAATTPAMAAGATTEIAKQPWTFAGLFGKYDTNQLQRGFQVFREVCASCHGARLVAFRTLAEAGGPHYSEDQVKALAAEYEVADPNAEGGVRPAVPADRWPSPFASDKDAADANGGAIPPDMSVLAKARGTTQPFPWWMLNYFTAYQEGGPDYIYALLTSYHEEVPHGVTDSEGNPFELPEGKYYNDVFPGHAISMAPPLADGQVVYAAAEDGSTVPATLDQYARDVSAFMMWMADPHLNARKEAGFRVLLFLFLFAGLMYAVKRRLWSGVEH